MTLPSAAVYDARILAQAGLQRYWIMDEANGDLVDEVASLHVVPTGSPNYHASDPFGGFGAVQFTAGSQKFSVGSHPFPTGNAARTVELWFKTDTSGGGTFTNLVSWATNSGGAQWAPEVGRSGSGRMGVLVWGDDYSIASSADDGTWHHLAFVHDPPHTKLYIDSAQIDDRTQFLNTSSGYAFYIAGIETYNVAPAGAVSRVAIYNAALDTADFAAHLAANPGADVVLLGGL